MLIAEYDPDWPVDFSSERDAILAADDGRIIAIEHIGSTSVVGLAAKPVIDIAVAVRSVDEDGSWLLTALAERGYRLGRTVMTGRLFLHRDQDGQRSHHLHILPIDRWDQLNERLLRDWLREHPADRDRYAALKYELAERTTDIDAYTSAKTDLIQELVDAARDAQGLVRVPVWED